MSRKFRSLGALFLGLALAVAVTGFVMTFAYAGTATVASASTPLTSGPVYPPSEP